MILSLNGNEIQGYGFLITGEQPLPDEDLSAQTSSTLTAEKGFKGKRLRVKLNIKFVDVGHLKRLMTLVQDVDAQGRRLVYTVNNQTATAMGIRQVRFSDRVSAKELDGPQAWEVSFVLLEHKSIPEKREAKTLASAEKAAADANKSSLLSNEPVPAIAKVASVDQQAAAEADSANWFEENVLGNLESWLSGKEGNVDVV